jgi:hypothetical protein
LLAAKIVCSIDLKISLRKLNCEKKIPILVFCWLVIFAYKSDFSVYYVIRVFRKAQLFICLLACEVSNLATFMHLYDA